MSKLHELFPTGNFSPPASIEEISQVEQSLEVALPEQLRLLLLESNGFREPKGFANYLLPLDSILKTTQYMWTEVSLVDLLGFIFFGYSGGDEAWGMSTDSSSRIISYHHHMIDEYEEVGSDIYDVYLADCAEYDE